MKSIAKILAIAAIAGFAFTAPAIAADIPTPAAPEAKADLGGALKEKAADVVEQAKDKADNTADKIQDALGAKKQPGEALETQKDALTTPQAPASDAAKTIIPDAPKAPVMK